MFWIHIKNTLDSFPEIRDSKIVRLRLFNCKFYIFNLHNDRLSKFTSCYGDFKRICFPGHHKFLFFAPKNFILINNSAIVVDWWTINLNFGCCVLLYSKDTSGILLCVELKRLLYVQVWFFFSFPLKLDLIGIKNEIIAIIPYASLFFFFQLMLLNHLIGNRFETWLSINDWA